MVKELEIISMSKKSIAIMQGDGIKGGRSKLPYTFTEQGIYMLMTVLKEELIIKFESRKLWLTN